VPGEDGVRGDDTSDFGQELPAEDLALCSEPAAFVVRETESLPAEPSLQDAILLKQVFDGQLLLALDPARDSDNQQCPELDRGAHERGFYPLAGQP
jgi:hypothetical protein